MEPFLAAAVTAAVTKVLDGAAGEAGASLWQSLSRLIGRFFPEGGEPHHALVAATANDPDTVTRLADALTREINQHGEVVTPW
jgi:hypothetical protein